MCNNQIPKNLIERYSSLHYYNWLNTSVSFLPSQLHMQQEPFKNKTFYCISSNVKNIVLFVLIRNYIILLYLLLFEISRHPFYNPYFYLFQTDGKLKIWTRFKYIRVITWVDSNMFWSHKKTCMPIFRKYIQPLAFGVMWILKMLMCIFRTTIILK